MTAFNRTITAGFELAAGATVSIVFSEQGEWGAGGHTVTSVLSLAVPTAPTPSYRKATITGGASDAKESWVLPAAGADDVDGDDEIVLTAGLWVVTFYCVLDVDPDAPTLNVVGAVVNSVPPWLSAALKVDGVTTYVEDFLVPWVIPD